MSKLLKGGKEGMVSGIYHNHAPLDCWVLLSYPETHFCFPNQFATTAASPVDPVDWTIREK